LFGWKLELVLSRYLQKDKQQYERFKADQLMQIQQHANQVSRREKSTLSGTH